MLRAALTLWLVLLPLTAVTTAPGEAQQGEPPDTTIRHAKAPILLSPVTVTATRTERSVFETPAPVSVIDRLTIRAHAPNTASDLFRGLAGLDVSGVGVTQVRPVIRGQRGQRILLLEDGLRLSNSRRQQDFGEIPAVVDLNSVRRVEVVRGPASVLYGSDAIGGVVNLITTTPSAEGIHGAAGYRFSSQDDQQKGTASVSGRFGAVSFRASGTARDAGRYAAPAGRFGDITLADKTPVQGTGAQDQSWDAYLAYRLSPAHEVFAKYERYSADTAGFGYVDPAAYAPTHPAIQITYPFQHVGKLRAGYRGSALGTFLADRLEVVGYVQDNQRRLNLDVFAPFGPGTPPGAGVGVSSRNFTDLATYGFRAEAMKAVGARLGLTYGADFFHDHSTNTDSSATTVVGFGPPSTTVSLRAQVPNATFRSLGAFVQGDVQVTARASLVLGVRYQDVGAGTEATPGLSAPTVASSDRTLVGSTNLLYRLTGGVTLFATAGRAFRSPNLVERFFDGPTPEGLGYQSPNPSLRAETSLDLDLGVRYRNGFLSLEGGAFRNTIFDGIRIAPTGSRIRGLAEYQNVNVDQLQYTGAEVSGDLALPLGLSLGGNYTHLSSKDALNPDNPVGETFSSKLAGYLRYEGGHGRYTAEYGIRHNGPRKDVSLGTSPVGPILPPFTVQDVRAGVVVVQRGSHTHRLGVAITNLGNVLYAEFPNASFFRPQPGRGVTLTWDMTF